MSLNDALKYREQHLCKSPPTQLPTLHLLPVNNQLDHKIDIDVRVAVFWRTSRLRLLSPFSRQNEQDEEQPKKSLYLVVFNPWPTGWFVVDLWLDQLSDWILSIFFGRLKGTSVIKGIPKRTPSEILAKIFHHLPYWNSHILGEFIWHIFLKTSRTWHIICVNYLLTKFHRISASDTSGPELTDAMMLKLSKKINTESDLRDLAIQGLAVSGDDLSRSLYKYPNDINGAAYDVLKAWRRKFQTGAAARLELREALKSVDMSYFLQTLEWH